MADLNPNVALDWANAHILARAADIAYYPEEVGKKRFADELSMPARLVSMDNTQVYIASNDQNILLAFRGSQAPTSLDGFKDWLLTNANNFLILPEGEIGTDFAAAGVGARFHRGFLQAIKDIWEPLFVGTDTLMREKERPLWITGHSLGGALALVAAWRLLQNFVAVHQVYTFGAPMVGNIAAMQAYEREFPNKIFRFCNKPDVVPWLPTVSLIANAFQHCPTEIPVDSNPDIEFTPAIFMKQLAGSVLDGVMTLNVMDKIWAALNDRVTSHDIVTYVDLIKQKHST